MLGSKHKKYIPVLHFVAQKAKKPHHWEKDTKNYLHLLAGTFPVSSHHSSLKDVVAAQTLSHKNSGEYLENMQNVSRSLAVDLIQLFSDVYDTQSDVVKACERVIDHGADASLGDHMLVGRIATQLNPNLQAIIS